MPLRVYNCLALLGFLAWLLWAGWHPSMPSAQMPAPVDCAQTFGCVEIMQHLGH